ncbi:MAG: hypothetical protein ACM3XS_07325 [Bacteroidota bacterium]
MADARLRKWPWILASLAAVFFGYALYLYERTGSPPISPKPRAAPAIRVTSNKRPAPALARYTAVAGGRIFFGAPAGPTAPGTAAPAYVSALMLRGITLGRTPTALLARAGSPPEAEAWTAKIGQTVLGETVVAIDRRSVTLRRDGQETVLFMPE